MSKLHTVQPGDDFARISRIVYGVADLGGAIRQANPGVTEPLQPGAELIIPAVPGIPTDATLPDSANNPDEVAVKIDDERFRFWETVTINRAIDAVDAVSFSAPFEPDRPEFREAFRPFTFKPVTVTVGGERLFSGTLVNVQPPLQGSRFEVAVSCYSRCGVLQDCTPPESAWPVEYDGFDLREIARAVVAPFGVSVDFQGPVGGGFERASCSPGTRVLSFLTDLAKQRNKVITSTPEGNLRIWESVPPGNPVAVLTQGESPLVSVVPAFSPQDYFSHITGMELVFLGWPGASYTVRNPFLRSPLRPDTFEFGDTLLADIEPAVRARRGRMFGNMVSYTVQVSTWRDPRGDLWRPNTTILLHAPNAMIYSPYEFLIRAVELSRDENTKTATLTLCLPGAFSGEVPGSLPWDE